MNELTIQKKEFLTKQAEAVLKRTSQDIIDLSQICHEYREVFGNQEYIRWVKEDLGLSERYGYNLLNVFKTFTAQCAVTQFDSSAIRLLSEAPEPARQEAIAKAESGEKVTHADAKAIIEKHKAELEEKEKQIKLQADCLKNAIQDRDNLKNQIKNIKPVEIEMVPDDYNDLISEKAALTQRIIKMKQEMDDAIASGVKSEVNKLQKDFDLKRKQKEAIESRIAVLKDTMQKMEAAAGDMTACRETIKTVRHDLYNISITLQDFFMDHSIPPEAEKDLQYLADEMAKGAQAFQDYLDGKENERKLVCLHES